MKLVVSEYLSSTATHVWISLKVRLYCIRTAFANGKEQMRFVTPEELNPTPLSEEEELNMREKVKELRYTRVLFIQALMYIFAFLLTWFFAIVSALMDNAYAITESAKTVLFPMQGFWNLIIFVFDKVFLVRSAEEHENLWYAIKCVFLHPEDIPSIVLTNIDVIMGSLEEQHNGEVVRFGFLRSHLNNEEKSNSKPDEENVSSAGAMRSFADS